MMDFNDTNRAISLQIADEIAARVMIGNLRPDERIPSVREYAATVMVNVNTVMRAYDHLSNLGVIYNRRGLGYFVAADAPERVAAERRKAFIEGGGIDKFFKQINMLGISPQQLAEMYDKYLSE